MKVQLNEEAIDAVLNGAVKSLGMDKVTKFKTLDEMTKDYILSVLKHTDGSVKKAAKILGRTHSAISHRLRQWDMRDPKHCERLDGSIYRGGK